MNHISSTRSQLAATALAAAALAAGVSAQAAPVNVMNAAGTVLMGIDGIQIADKTYDVRFVDGTCVALFDGCSTNTNSFLFTTVTDVRAATTALGAALLGSALPGTINGLTLNSSFANIFTPYALNGEVAVADALRFVSTTNTNAFMNGPFTISYVSQNAMPNFDFAASGAIVYAVWSASTPTPSANDVPEPGSLALSAVGLGAAFLAAGKTRRRRSV